MSLFTTCLVVAAVALLTAWPVALWREKRTFSRPAAAFLRLHPAGRVMVAVLVALALRAGGSKRASGDNSLQDASPVRESGVVPRQASPTDGNANAFAITFFDLDPSSSNITFGVSWGTNTFENAASRNVALFSSTNLLEHKWTLSGEYPMPASATSHTFMVSAANVLPSACTAFLDSLAGRGFYQFGLDMDTDGDGLADSFESLVTLTDPLASDSDLDGLPDGVEWSLGTDPTERDTDGDWFVDGSDPDPLAPTAWEDFDGDGIPDAYEIHWFGGTGTVDSAEMLGANGFTVGFDLAAGINPTDAAEAAFMPTNGIVAWKIADAFMALGPGNTNSVYERTFDVARHGGWEQFFISSRLDRAGEWCLQGLVLEWEDSEGESGLATSSPTGDSWRLSLSTNSPERLTVRLNPIAIENACRTPLYLLAYSPGVAVDEAQTVATSDGAWVVAEIKEESTLAVTLDRSGRPCEAGLCQQELDAELTTGGGRLRLRASGTMRVEAPGVYELPGFVPLADAQPRMRGDRTTPQSPCPETSGFRLAFLNPEISYGRWHGGSIRGLAYSHATGTYSETCDFPLDSDCLRRSWHADASGGYACSCEPELSVGVDIDAYADFTTNMVVGSDRATGTVSIGGVQVWSGTAKHDVATLGVTGPELLNGGECDGCSSCENGNCDELEGGNLGSLKFRIPLGVPRKGQVSGFAWFMAKEPLTIGVDTMQVLRRADAQVADTSVGSGRTIVCGDNRGRTLSIQPAADGIEVTVTESDSGKLEHTWRIMNVNGSAAQIRLWKISRLGNTMSDDTYIYGNGDWTKFDNVSQTSEELVATGDINEDGYKREERILRDADNATLSHTITESRRFGSFANAVLRQTYHAEKSWGDDNWNESFASYYTDNENPKRNGNVRLERGNARAWRFYAYDTEGRTILTLDQRDGSECPAQMLEGIGACAFDGTNVLEWLQAQTFTAVATIYDYTPLAGDGAFAVDADKVRTETRYLVEDGTVTLIGRTWTRYTHGLANGYATVTVETTTAGAQGATIGDVRNAHRVETCYDEDAMGVPLVLRGALAEELDEDGVLTQNTYTISNGVVSCTSCKSYQSHQFPVASVTERDTTYGNLLAERSVHVASGIAFDEKRHLYDGKNRLRSTIYADGSSTTNAYSCCRLLWSQDRTGRKVLRSAVTGEDHLYYAMEEVSLADLPHDYGTPGWQFEPDGAYRVTQHFMDALGRETNTVVRTCDSPGAATNIDWYCSGWQTSETTAYPYGVSDYEVSTDIRGNETTTIRYAYSDSEEVETIETNKNTVSTTYRNGATILYEEWPDGKWKETLQTSSYGANGCRIDTTTITASDHSEVTARTVYRDFLGRMVREVRPTMDVAYTYDGASSRVLSAIDSISGETTTRLYNDLGETVGQAKDSVVSRSNTGYEAESNVLWRVSSQTVAGSITNLCAVTKERLTGLSDELRGETLTYLNSALSLHSYSYFDSTNSVMTEVSESVASGTTATKSKFGIAFETTKPGGTTSCFFDPYGRVFYTEKNGRSVDWIGRNDFGDVVEYDTFHSEGNSYYAEFYGYDSFGNRIAATNALGAVTYSAYDAANRLAESGGAVYPVRNGYDTDGRRTSLTTFRDAGGPGSVPAADGDTTTWTFDPATGFCTVKTYADGSTVTYSYTTDGNPLRTTYASGRWRENAYNAKRELVSTEYSDGDVCAFAYDEFSHEIAASNDVAAVLLVRNEHGQVTNEATTVGAESRTIDRKFDALGRMTVCDESDYVYSPDGQIASISNAIASVEYSYTADRLDAGYVLTLSNGLVLARSLTRDAYRRSLVTGIDNSANNVVVESFAYAFDALNRPISRNADTFGYNDRSEVTNAIVSGQTEFHAYDEIGNSLWGGTTSNGYSYVSNSRNQYSEVWYAGDWGCPSDPVASAYDADGNMTQFGEWTYTYDAANRLKTVSTNGVLLLTNFYDAKSRRVKKVTPEATTTFFYDDWNLIEERVAYTNSTSSTIRYFWGKDISGTLQGAGGVGGLLYLTVSNSYTPNSPTHQLYIPFYDNIGNVTRYVDGNGNTVAQYTYDAFGKLIAKSGPLTDFFRHRFSTKYFDAETGLYYYGYRFYNPILMRWLNRDPMGEEGGLNLYGFCHNNSLCGYDELGLEWVIERNPSKRWAVARKTSRKDTIMMLAAKLKLNFNERGKWLKRNKDNPCLFEVPNVFCVYTSKSGWLDNNVAVVTHLKRKAVSDSDRYKSKGFMVIAHQWTDSDNTFIDMWTEDGIYAVSFGGHGTVSGFKAETSSDTDVSPNLVRPPYHLSAVRAYSCVSSMYFETGSILPNGTMLKCSWRDHVSSEGTFVGYSGSVFWFNMSKQEVSINENGQ